jgi:hypothetical protein
MIVTATQFVIDLDIVIKNGSGTSSLWDRMLELDAMIEPIMTKADSWILSSTPQSTLDWSELSVVHSLRGIARIKINSARIKVHRYCAFSDMPVFEKKHCDLAAVPNASSRNRSTSPGCACSTTYHSTIQALLDSSNDNPAYTTAATPPIGCEILPFSSTFSSKVCLRAAFNISRSFQMLPYPSSSSTLTTFSTPPNSLSFNNQMLETPVNPATQHPRMMPMFACCAMQASYAMVMLSYKSKNMGFIGGPSQGAPFVDLNGNIQGQVSQLTRKLEEGLEMVLGALKNYAVAYEALGGMRDQIEIAARNVGGGGNVNSREVLMVAPGCSGPGKV